jgi:hypothetical protein
MLFYFDAVHQAKDGSSLDFSYIPDYLTYISPSGLPYSIPKQCQDLNFSGYLYNYALEEKIYISKEALTSFKFNDQIYIARSDGEDFFGYVCNTCFEDEFRKDEHTLYHQDKLEIVEDDIFERIPKQFPELEDMTEPYYATGELITACQYCREPDCHGECRDICHKCKQLMKNCYCGLACVCFTDEPVHSCKLNRNLRRVGIPFFENENLVVKKYVMNPITQQDIYYNIMLTQQGLNLFKARLGVTNGQSLEEIISNVAEISDYLEQTTSGSLQTIFRTFNRLHALDGTINALENEEYALAFHNVIKSIPIVGDALGGFESILAYVYSESFNENLKQFSTRELRALGNCTTPNCNRYREELEMFRIIAENCLNKIESAKNEEIHHRICTCP